VSAEKERPSCNRKAWREIWLLPSCNRKAWSEIWLLPIALTVVGVLSTHIITSQQLESAKIIAESDREVQLLQIVADHIMGTDDRKRKFAVALVRALDPDLERRVLRSLTELEPPYTPVGTIIHAERRAADAAVRERRADTRIFIMIRNEQDRPAAQAIAEKLEAERFVVFSRGYLEREGPAHTELRYFRAEDELEAMLLRGILVDVDIAINLKHMRGFGVPQRQFELWIAPRR